MLRRRVISREANRNDHSRLVTFIVHQPSKDYVHDRPHRPACPVLYATNPVRDGRHRGGLARSSLRIAAPRVGVLLLDSAVPPLDADLRFRLLLRDLDGPLHDLGLAVALGHCSG